MNTFQRNSICSAIVLALGLPASSLANTIVVDGTTCTLRDAVNSANYNLAYGGCTAGSAGEDTIQITADQTLAGTQVVISSIKFIGMGAPAPIITTSNTMRLFWIGEPTSTPAVSFDNLQLKGGMAQGGNGTDGGGAGAGLGGAVAVFDGNVQFNHVVFANNIASGGSGSTSIGNATGGGGGGGMSGDGGSGGTGGTNGGPGQSGP
ncbi:MAG: hypothetical protein WCD66_09265, partial [Rhodanobacteraceae bacterium]